MSFRSPKGRRNLYLPSWQQSLFTLSPFSNPASTFQTCFPRGLPQHIRQADPRMVDALIEIHNLAVDRAFRAPVITRVAGFAALLPHRPVCHHFNVTHRAYPGADSAAGALLIHAKAAVRQRDQIFKGGIGFVGKLPVPGDRQPLLKAHKRCQQ